MARNASPDKSAFPVIYWIVRCFTTNQACRNIALTCIYSGMAAGSFLFAYLLRFDFEPSPSEMWHFLELLPILLLVNLAAMIMAGQFRCLLTFYALADLYIVVQAGLLSTFVLFGLWYLSGGSLSPPRSVLIMSGLTFIGSVSAFRLYLRRFRDQQHGSLPERFETVAIIGAGEAGSNLARQFMRRSSFGLKPVVFLDDDNTKWGQMLHGIPIAGDPSWLLGRKVPKTLSRVIIAMPEAPRKRIKEIIETLDGKGYRLDTVFSVADQIDKKMSAPQLRPVDIDDLLGREPASLDSECIRSMIEGQVVAVTGAGGSIGSELCRQILLFQPRKLLLIDQSEGLLFVIEQELIEKGFGQLIVPLVANIRDPQRVGQIFSRYHPIHIFHAAAHKHVPMMESQPVEAIKNNAVGSLRLAQMALQYGVKSFVLVSTDKAINPTNVMGATKRMAEIFLQAMQDKHPGATRFISVRFGNVLGSSGSVVPIFHKQIAAGGPVKVTHPDITRYFMTIPEAVGLVLQSATMGAGGEIFMLDMGQPIKILELARSMILLQGFKPEIDIKIEFTGLRPGEKMFEELSYGHEESAATEHPKVFKLATKSLPMEILMGKLAELEAGFGKVGHDELKRRITSLVPEYTPFIDKKTDGSQTDHFSMDVQGL